MWPLSGREVAEALGGAIDPALADVSITGVTTDLARRGSRGDLFVVFDPRLHPHVARVLEEGAELAVVASQWGGFTALSPELRARCIRVARPLAAFRLLAQALRRRFSFPVIAVGGSNGKTTTKEMIASVLACSARRVTKTPGTNNGWVGTPIVLCDSAHRKESPPDALVLEIGIDEVGAMADHVRIAAPDLAVLTALGPEHLTGLGTWEAGVREEMKLFEAPRRVWLASDPRIREHMQNARIDDVVVHAVGDEVTVPCPTVAFAWRAAGPERGSVDLAFHTHGAEVARVTAEIPLPGRHNGTNAALAFAVGFALGCGPRAMGEAFRAFVPPPQRTSVTSLECGAALIDDTYNASPASMRAALAIVRDFPHRTKLVVLGDMLDLDRETEAHHEALAPLVDALAIDLAARGETLHVRLHGAAMEALSRSLSRENVASFAWQDADHDPATLLDRADYGDTCVLIKGSRGMRMERAVARMRDLGRDAWKADVIAIAVAGFESVEAARAIRASTPPHVRVRSIDPAAIANGALTRAPFRIALFTGLPEDAADPEQTLALFAQAFVHLAKGGIAVLAAEDDVASLLAEVVPPHAIVVRPPKTRLIPAALEAIASLA